MKHWLLADHALAAHLFDEAVGIRDLPVTADELHRLRALVFYLHVIGPDILVFIWFRLFL